MTRSLGFQVTAPSDWAPLGEVWRWVQANCGWPAPAIVVAGASMQLWFALAEPVPVVEAQAWLGGLVRRMPARLPRHRLAIWPLPADAEEAAGAAELHASGGWPDGLVALDPPRVPHALDTDDERWTAFVASDLAPLFAETPWLDVAPSLDGQAQLLAALRPVSAVEWAQAQGLVLQPPELAASRTAAEADLAPALDDRADHGEIPSGDGAEVHQDPAAFLHAAMNNPGVPWIARIEAAKALLNLRAPGARSGDGV